MLFTLQSIHYLQIDFFQPNQKKFTQLIAPNEGQRKLFRFCWTIHNMHKNIQETNANLSKAEETLWPENSNGFGNLKPTKWTLWYCRTASMTKYMTTRHYCDINFSSQTNPTKPCCLCCISLFCCSFNPFLHNQNNLTCHFGIGGIVLKPIFDPGCHLIFRRVKTDIHVIKSIHSIQTIQEKGNNNSREQLYFSLWLSKIITVKLVSQRWYSLQCYPHTQILFIIW